MRIASRSRALAVAVTVGLGANAIVLAAPVSLAVTDGIGQSSFITDTLNHWNPPGAPVAGNAYTVPGTLNLRTPADSGNNTFAGDSLTLGVASSGQLILKNANNAVITVDNVTLDGGQIQNGGTAAGTATFLTFAGNGINITANHGTFNVPGGRTINFTSPVSGVGNANITGGGLTRFSGGLSNAGNVSTTTNGTVAGITNNLTQNIQVANNSGFAAYGGDRTINSGGAGSTLTWGSGGFAPGNFLLSHSTADAKLTVQNPIDMGASVRTVEVLNGLAVVDAELSGALASTSAGGFTKTGAGRLVLSGTATAFSGKLAFPAGGSIGDNGVVRIASNGALGSGTIDMPGNNATSQIIEVIGGITVPNNLFTQGRTFAGSNVFLRNVSGNNNWTGNITISSTGAATYAIDSAADNLWIGGAMTTTLNAATQRTFALLGAGNGEVNGAISNSSTATPTVIAVSKSGPGKWILSGNNTYTGPTTVTQGILELGASNRIADVSQMSLGGGEFGTAGFSETLATLVMTASSSIDMGAGASILQFANSAAQSWTGTLTIKNWTGSIAGGSPDKIFFGSDDTGLTSAQLAQITFDGYAPGARFVEDGEIAPVPEPGSATLLALGALGLIKRRPRRI